jgi:hypothetical protein
VTPDGGGRLHPDFDEDRWVTTKGSDERLFLGYNPYTHIGRIGVWVPSLGHGTRISLSDVTDASPLARAWLDGFLAGSGPDPEVMFGDGIYDLPDDHPPWKRWREALHEFRHTGDWEAGRWVEVTAIEGDVDLVQPAWVRRGPEIWVWTGTAWAEAEPQPAWSWAFLTGSICEIRQTHSEDEVGIDDRHTQCGDCGRIFEREPPT